MRINFGFDSIDKYWIIMWICGVFFFFEGDVMVVKSCCYYFKVNLKFDIVLVIVWIKCRLMK